MTRLVTLVALAFFLIAGNAYADTSMTPVGATLATPEEVEIRGTVGGTEREVFPQLFETRLDGTTAWAYCLDVTQSILYDAAHRESSWAESGAANLGNVARILARYPADATYARGRWQEVTAVQAAIWHFTDGFELTSAPDDVLALYREIVADAEANPLSEPAATATLTLSPESRSGTAGEYLEFTLVTGATGTVSLSVSPTGGATIVTCDAAHTPITSVTGPYSGTVCLHRATAGGPVTLTASASATVFRARVFVPPAANWQRLVLGDDRTVTVSDSATATWSEGPPPPPPVDVCPNIPGVQPTIPPGMVKDANGNCVTPSSPPSSPSMSDDCPNLPGVQGSVPEGMVKDASGNCVARPAPTSTSTPPATDVCPNIAASRRRFRRA